MKKFAPVLFLSILTICLCSEFVYSQKKTDHLFLAPLNKKINNFSVSFSVPSHLRTVTEWLGSSSAKTESIEEDKSFDLTISSDWTKGDKGFNMKGNTFFMSLMNKEENLMISGELSAKGDMLKECTVEYHKFTETDTVYMKATVDDVPLYNKYQPGYYTVTPGSNKKDYFRNEDYKSINSNPVNRTTTTFLRAGEVKMQAFSLTFN